MIKCECNPYCKMYIGVDHPYGLRVEWETSKGVREVEHFRLDPNKIVLLIAELRGELLRQAGLVVDETEG